MTIIDDSTTTTSASITTKSERESAAPATWHKTACILCECNCGVEIRLGPDGHTFERIRGDKAHPGVAGVHLREGAAPRPLPERSRRAGAPPAAPPRRRHLRGGRLGHRRS